MVNLNTTFKKVEDKEKKIECLQRIDDNVSKTLQIIRELYAVEDKKASAELVAILDNLLSSDDWETSLLLRATKKHLTALKDEAKQIATKLNGNAELKVRQEVNATLKEGHLKIYISLYQAKGSSIKVWHKMLKSLANYSMSRPVYANEEHVREVIRSKPDMQRHAYAIVAIANDNIINLGKKPVDSFNHELLMLKEGTVQLQNIIEFVHANEKHYVFKNDELILVTRG